MNSEVNNWDDLVRQKLEQFSPEPPPEIWDHIRSGISVKKREPRLVYLRWISAAAVMVLAMITGILVVHNPSGTSEDAVTVKHIQERPFDRLPKRDHIPVETGSSKSGTSPVLTTSLPDQPSSHMTGNEDSGERNEVPAVLAMISIPSSGRAPRETLENDLPDKSLIIKSRNKSNVLPPDEDVVLVLDTKMETRSVKKRPEWKVGVLLTPGYSSYSASYSENYSKKMSSAANRSETGVGGGISVQYKNSRRLKIESGLYYARSGDNAGGSNHFFASGADYAYLDIGETKFYSNAVNLNNGQISMNSTAGVIRLTRKPEDAKLIAGAETALGMSNTLLSSGEFYQVFDFIEIPLTARFRIIDRKIGIELSGGISTNFVIGNQVFMSNGTGRDYVGKTEEITPVGFAGLAGLGLVYPLGKHVSLSVEPRGSYWINSLNSSGDVDFKPWRIGVYSGLTYSF